MRAGSYGPAGRLALSAQVLLCLLLSTVLPAPAVTEEPFPLELRVKAAFIYHFAQFVQWPAKPDIDGNAVTLIGVLGNDRLAAAVEDAISGKKVGGRSLAVIRYSTVESIEPCHILYIENAGESEVVSQVMEKLGAYPVVTVGDNPGFAEQGGIINFFQAGNKIRFEINPAAARSAGLTISSKLLNLARIVKTKADENG